MCKRATCIETIKLAIACNPSMTLLHWLDTEDRHFMQVEVGILGEAEPG